MAVILSAAAVSCSLIHDDKVVARVGRTKLYHSEVVKFIPPGTPAADSLDLARKYINAWAGELIMNEMASTQLSKREMDVTREMEEYKSSLLKYRYEQHYIEERLDTCVSGEEIEAHYAESGMKYRLEVPIVKARFIRISVNCPIRDQILQLLSSRDEGAVEMLDSLSYTVADHWTDYGGQWVDLVTLARDFHTDYGTLSAAIRDMRIEMPHENGLENIAVIHDMIPSGKTAPLEYCSARIRNSILARRKFILSTTLEQDLLRDAAEKGTFIVYDTDEK